MNLLFKKISVGALLLIVAGAVLFCALSTMSQSGSAMAGMLPDRMNTDHFAYIQELTTATTTANFLTLIVLFSVAIATTADIPASNDSSLDDRSLSYFLKKQHDVLGLTQQTTHRWLSRFENSPSFALAA